MEITNRNSVGLLEEVTGPLRYAWKNDPATYSTTTFLVIMKKEPYYFPMTPIEQVHLVLKFFGFTKTELAMIIGISRPALYAWIDGTSEPSGENHEKLMKLAQMAHDINACPGNSLFHGYIDRPLPGYEKSLLDYLSGNPDKTKTVTSLVQKIYELTQKRRERLDAIPKATYVSESGSLEDNLELLKNAE